MDLTDRPQVPFPRRPPRPPATLAPAARMAARLAPPAPSSRASSSAARGDTLRRLAETHRTLADLYEERAEEEDVGVLKGAAKEREIKRMHYVRHTFQKMHSRPRINNYSQEYGKSRLKNFTQPTGGWTRSCWWQMGCSRSLRASMS